MNKIKLFLVAFVAILISCSNPHSDLGDGIFALISTNKGDIIVKLEYEKVPITTANFISLAEGKNPFVEEQYKGKPFYDGLTFHRVMPNFMIQGGDPLGNGSGGPGYKFKDEFHPELKHSKAGILSMANAGPGTNGSQFFITHNETAWLDNKHSVFGEVIKGMEIVNEIAQNDQISKITIIRNGANAKKFDAVKVFQNYYDEIAKNDEKVKSAKKSYLDENRKLATKLASGLAYTIVKKGTGKKPAKGTQVFIHYAGYFENGDMFDTSYESVAAEYGKLDEQRKMMNGYAPFPFTYGDKQGLIPGFIEGIENMNFGEKALVYIPSSIGYGEAGNGPVPPNTDLVFEIELIEKQP